MGHDEIWKTIDFADGRYAISNKGTIVNNLSKRILKPNNVHHGYLQVTLCFNTYRKSFLVHRLVALAFKDNPKNLSQINHKDRDTGNNNDWNLEWVTASDNVKHSYDCGRVMPSVKGRKYRILDKLQISVIKSVRGNIPVLRLAYYFKVNPSTIRKALTR